VNATIETPALAVKSTSVKSCSAFSLAHEDKRGTRTLTCKRLPMHKGDCRATLHAPTVKRAVKRGKVGGRSKSRVTLVDAFATIAADLEAGKITAGQALAKAAAFVTAAGKPKAARVTTAKGETAGSTVVIA
jgi:hypothetical protein